MKVSLFFLILSRFCEGRQDMVCGLVAFNNLKSYYILNNGHCYDPVGSASSNVGMTYPHSYYNIGNQALLLRIVSGSRITSYEYYTSTTNYNNTAGEPYNKDLNYKSPLLQEWSNITPKIMNVTIKDNVGVVAWLTFNVMKGDSLESWFSQDHLVASYPWNVTLLKAGSYYYFTVIGAEYHFIINYIRRFYISSSWISCPGDVGALMIMDMVDLCEYIPGLKTNFIPPQILYTVVNGDAGVIKGNAKHGKYFEIWATYEDNIIIMA